MIMELTGELLLAVVTWSSRWGFLLTRGARALPWFASNASHFPATLWDTSTVRGEWQGLAEAAHIAKARAGKANGWPGRVEGLVEGIRAAAHTARQRGNITLAKRWTLPDSRYTSPTLTRSTPTTMPSGCWSKT